MSKNLIPVSLLVLLALGGASIVTVNAGGRQHENQVVICHFNGHGGDFVAGNQNFPGPAGRCTNIGAIELWVSERGCRRGHNAGTSPRVNKTCENY